MKDLKIFSLNTERAESKEIHDYLSNNPDLARSALESLEKKCSSGEIGFRDYSYSDDRLRFIEETSSWVRSKAKDFVVLGIGGSSLGGKTIMSSLVDSYSNEGTRVHFMDNVDPSMFSELLNSLDLSSTVFNVISKSGSTAETMAQFLIIYDKLSKSLGKKEAVERIILTTDPEEGALRPLVSSMGFKSFDVPQNIGGRFSVLTDVGILPSAVSGVNIRELLQGAKKVVDISDSPEPETNMPLKYALIKYAHAKTGKTSSVIMPYSSKLSCLSFWYVQLWAESLGKKGMGQTPIPAVGATDQHSQLQLFMEGPKDKFISFLGIEKVKNDLSIPAFETQIEAFSYLSGHSMNELIRAEMFSTERALYENNVPSVRIELPELNAYNLGAIFMFFQISVALTGEFMKIDAFNQPGVELSKKYTYKMMGRKGY